MRSDRGPLDESRFRFRGGFKTGINPNLVAPVETATFDQHDILTETEEPSR